MAMDLGFTPLWLFLNRQVFSRISDKNVIKCQDTAEESTQWLVIHTYTDTSSMTVFRSLRAQLFFHGILSVLDLRNTDNRVIDILIVISA